MARPLEGQLLTQNQQDMETDTSGFQAPGDLIFRDTGGTFRSGSYSLIWENGGSHSGGSLHLLHPGDDDDLWPVHYAWTSLRFSGWALQQPPLPNPDVTVEFIWYDADFNVIQTSDALTPLPHPSDGVTWTELSQEDDVPAGARWVAIRLIFSLHPGRGDTALPSSINFDDFSLIARVGGAGGSPHVVNTWSSS